ncbi:hypothetical protein Taro_015863 [Colocasia esculenta]|uniref:Uncharacterized protein n=1 Tax=Colocasia esculenta TaxID=4460 RepID=A0A843UNK6_COLES|nr:hypothetical protein [Colocasia esculenta]
MANVGSLSLVCGLRALCGRCGPEVLAQTAHRFTGCERDGAERRVLNVKVSYVIQSRGALSGVRGGYYGASEPFTGIWWFVRCGVHARKVSEVWVRRCVVVFAFCGFFKLVPVLFVGNCLSWYAMYQPFQVLRWSCAPWRSGCVVLVGLHCSLALLCGCGAAVGPFVLDCETEK